eukprot:1941224-Rhodomonas_salina.2
MRLNAVGRRTTGLLFSFYTTYSAEHRSSNHKNTTNLFADSAIRSSARRASAAVLRSPPASNRLHLTHFTVDHKFTSITDVNRALRSPAGGGACTPRRSHPGGCASASTSGRSGRAQSGSGHASGPWPRHPSRWGEGRQRSGRERQPGACRTQTERAGSSAQGAGRPVRAAGTPGGAAGTPAGAAGTPAGAAGTPAGAGCRRAQPGPGPRQPRHRCGGGGTPRRTHPRGCGSAWTWGRSGQAGSGSGCESGPWPHHPSRRREGHRRSAGSSQTCGARCCRAGASRPGRQQIQRQEGRSWCSVVGERRGRGRD